MNALVAYPLAVGILVLVGALPSSTMKATRSPWYTCIKPSLTPPSFVFPIVWSTLYAMIAVVLANVLIMSPQSSQRSAVLCMLALNLILNICWSFSYFGAGKIKLAFAIIVCILATNAVLLYLLLKSSKTRWLAYMLMPYTAWLLFAAVLNALSIAKEKGCADQSRKSKDVTLANQSRS
jgi:tryptophan-rich sensory protein